MAYIPPNPNGQALSAASAPVVIASDQAPIPITGNQSAVQTASWTSATAANTALTVATNNLNTATVTVVAGSTMTAGALTFEVSPDAGTSWFAVSMARIDSYTVESSFSPLTAGLTRAWTTSVDAFSQFRVRLSTAITGTGTLTVKASAQLFAIEPIITVGQSVGSQLNTTSAISSIAAGANTIGKVNIAPQSSLGATTFTLLSAASTNSTLVRGAAALLYMLTATNNSGTVAFLKVYNKASAPTVGTDTPVFTFLIPSNGGIAVPIPVVGTTFSLGIGIAITGLAPLNDTTAVAINQVQVNGAWG